MQGGGRSEEVQAKLDSFMKKSPGSSPEGAPSYGDGDNGYAIDRAQRALDSGTVTDPFLQSMYGRIAKTNTPIDWWERLWMDEFYQQTSSPITMPLIGAAMSGYSLKSAAAAREAGIATDGQIEMLKNYDANQGRGMTFGAKSVGIVRDILGYGVDMALTGGVGAAGRTAVKAGFTVGFGEAVKGGTSNIIGKAFFTGFRARSNMSNMQGAGRVVAEFGEAAMKTPGMVARMTLQGETVSGALNLANIETAGGRMRARAYTNVLHNQYGYVGRDPLDTAERLVDDSYGMWSHAIPKAVMGELIETWSENLGVGIAHMVPAFKLAILGGVKTAGVKVGREGVKETGAAFTAGGSTERMLSFLGLAGDTQTQGLLSAAGVSGFAPEMLEEVASALASDTVHAMFPELADAGNFKYLSDNMGSTALGLAIGIFGMSGGAHALAGTISHVDGPQVYDRLSPEGKKMFDEMVASADVPNRQGVARTIQYLEALRSEGFTAEGSAVILAGPSLRSRFHAANGIRGAAADRVIANASTDKGTSEEVMDSRGGATDDAVDQEIALMWEDFHKLSIKKVDGDVVSYPAIEFLKNHGVIEKDGAAEILGEMRQRVAAMRKASADGSLDRYLSLFRDDRASEIIADSMDSDGEVTPATKLAAFAQAQADAAELSRLLGGGESGAADELVARGAFSAALEDESVGGRVAGAAQEAEGEARAAVRRSIEGVNSKHNTRLRPVGDADPNAAVGWARQAGLTTVSVEDVAGDNSVAAYWDEANRVLAYNPKAIEAMATNEGLDIDVAYRRVIIKEMVQAHKSSLGSKGGAWVKAAEKVLLSIGAKADVEISENANFYGRDGATDRLNWVARRLGEVAVGPVDGDTKSPGVRGIFKDLLGRLLNWILPRSSALKKALADLRTQLNAAGLNGSELNDQDLMLLHLTQSHLTEIFGMFKTPEEVMLGAIRQKAKELPNLDDPEVDDTDYSSFQAGGNTEESRAQYDRSQLEARLAEHELRDETLTTAIERRGLTNSDLAREADSADARRSRGEGYGRKDMRLADAPGPAAPYQVDPRYAPITEAYLKTLNRADIVKLAKFLKENGVIVLNSTGSHARIMETILEGIALKYKDPRSVAQSKDAGAVGDPAPRLGFDALVFTRREEVTGKSFDIGIESSAETEEREAQLDINSEHDDGHVMPGAVQRDNELHAPRWGLAPFNLAEEGDVVLVNTSRSGEPPYWARVTVAGKNRKGKLDAFVTVIPIKPNDAGSFGATIGTPGFTQARVSRANLYHPRYSIRLVGNLMVSDADGRLLEGANDLRWVASGVTGIAGERVYSEGSRYSKGEGDIADIGAAPSEADVMAAARRLSDRMTVPWGEIYEAPEGYTPKAEMEISQGIEDAERAQARFTEPVHSDYSSITSPWLESLDRAGLVAVAVKLREDGLQVAGIHANASDADIRESILKTVYGKKVKPFWEHAQHRYSFWGAISDYISADIAIAQKLIHFRNGKMTVNKAIIRTANRAKDSGSALTKSDMHVLELEQTNAWEKLLEVIAPEISLLLQGRISESGLRALAKTEKAGDRKAAMLMLAESFSKVDGQDAVKGGQTFKVDDMSAENPDRDEGMSGFADSRADNTNVKAPLDTLDDSAGRKTLSEGVDAGKGDPNIRRAEEVMSHFYSNMLALAIPSGPGAKGMFDMLNEFKKEMEDKGVAFGSGMAWWDRWQGAHSGVYSDPAFLAAVNQLALASPRSRERSDSVLPLDEAGSGWQVVSVAAMFVSPMQPVVGPDNTTVMLPPMFRHGVNIARHLYENIPISFVPTTDLKRLTDPVLVQRMESHGPDLAAAIADGSGGAVLEILEKIGAKGITGLSIGRVQKAKASVELAMAEVAKRELESIDSKKKEYNVQGYLTIGARGFARQMALQTHDLIGPAIKIATVMANIKVIGTSLIVERLKLQSIIAANPSFSEGDTSGIDQALLTGGQAALDAIDAKIRIIERVSDSFANGEMWEAIEILRVEHTLAPRIVLATREKSIHRVPLLNPRLIERRRQFTAPLNGGYDAIVAGTPVGDVTYLLNPFAALQAGKTPHRSAPVRSASVHGQRNRDTRDVVDMHRWAVKTRSDADTQDARTSPGYSDEASAGDPAVEDMERGYPFQHNLQTPADREAGFGGFLGVLQANLNEQAGPSMLPSPFYLELIDALGMAKTPAQVKKAAAKIPGSKKNAPAPGLNVREQVDHWITEIVKVMQPKAKGDWVVFRSAIGPGRSQEITLRNQETGLIIKAAYVGRKGNYDGWTVTGGGAAQSAVMDALRESYNTVDQGIRFTEETLSGVPESPVYDDAEVEESGQQSPAEQERLTEEHLAQGGPLDWGPAGGSPPQVNSMRQAGTSHYGNPFTNLSGPTRAAQKVGSIPEAVEAYSGWLAGTAHKAVARSQREWILKQIDSGALDSVDLTYYKGGYRSHAHALADFVAARRGELLKPQVVITRGGVVAKPESRPTSEDATPDLDSIMDGLSNINRDLEGDYDTDVNFMAVNPVKSIHERLQAGDVAPPKVWDVANMSAIGGVHWKPAVFLMVYDEWNGQTNRAQALASFESGRYGRAVRDFVEGTEKLRGNDRRKRESEIRRALLVYIDVTGWLSAAGQARQLKLRNKVIAKTPAELWEVMSRSRVIGGKRVASALTAEHKKVFDLAMSFDSQTDSHFRPIWDIAQEMHDRQLAVTQASKDAELITGGVDWYMSLNWNRPEDQRDIVDHGVGSFIAGIGNKALSKTAISVVEGWAMGWSLTNGDGVSVQKQTRLSVYEARHNKAMLNSLLLSKVITRSSRKGVRQGNKALLHGDFKGYEAVEWVARYLNNATSKYSVRDIENRVFRGYMHVTVAAKHALLLFGFFHHRSLQGSYAKTIGTAESLRAYMDSPRNMGASFRSYAVAMGWGDRASLDEMARGAEGYKIGQELWEKEDPFLMELIEADLTIQVDEEVLATYGGGYETAEVQNFDSWMAKQRDMLISKGAPAGLVNKFVDMLNTGRAVQQETATWLFNDFGANLKAAAAVLKYKEALKKHEARLKTDYDGSFRRELATQVAHLVNKDFGGINQRGRSGKIEDALGFAGPRHAKNYMTSRALLLASDWTESNLMTVVGAIFKDGRMGSTQEIDQIGKNMHRQMWARVATRAIILQTIGNMILAGLDDDRDMADMYIEAGLPGFGDDEAPHWGKLRWLDINMSIFSPDSSRKFASTWGQFADPGHWLALALTDVPGHGIMAPYIRKASPGVKMVMELITGKDWAGRVYTDHDELAGTDNKGLFQKSVRRKDGSWSWRGDPKGGRLKGQTSKQGLGSGGVGPSQMPSYIIEQLRRFVPIQARTLFDMSMGSKDWIDFIGDLSGFKMSTTYPKDE